MIQAAFAGLPNTGKSTWINLLSNSHMMTGNWSGVTIEKNEASTVYENHLIRLLDLPGFHGFHQSSDEERIAEQVLNQHQIDVIVFVMDACHMKSSLRLFLDVRNLQIPMVLLISFKDLAEKNSIHIDLRRLSRRLSVPIVYADVHDESMRDVLLKHVIEASQKHVQYRPLLNMDADRMFEQYARFHSMKDAIELFKNHYHEIFEQEKENAVESCMKFVSGSFTESCMKSLKIDSFLLGTKLGKLILMCGVFSCLFFLMTLGLAVSSSFSHLLNLIESLIFCVLPDYGILVSFLREVVFAGADALLGLLPVLFLLSFFHAFLEESGIMARISLIADAWMRNMGLTGKSLLCFLMAHGCNVPAVIASSSLEDEAIRLKTALLIPFCFCSARCAVLISFVQLMFHQDQLLIGLCCYLLGLILILLLSLVMNQFHEFQISETDLIELPSYRSLDYSILLSKAFHQCRNYVQKVVQLLFSVCTIIWMMMKVSLGSMSLYEWLMRAVSVLFVPLKFGQYWGYAASLIPGILAKEASFGIFSMLKNSTSNALSTDVTVNLIYLFFVMTTIPCIMTLSCQKQRYGWKFALKSACFSFVVSYLICWLFVQFIMFFS